MDPWRAVAAVAAAWDPWEAAAALAAAWGRWVAAAAVAAAWGLWAVAAAWVRWGLWDSICDPNLCCMLIGEKANPSSEWRAIGYDTLLAFQEHWLHGQHGRRSRHDSQTARRPGSMASWAPGCHANRQLHGQYRHAAFQAMPAARRQGIQASRHPGIQAARQPGIQAASPLPRFMPPQPDSRPARWLLHGEHGRHVRHVRRVCDRLPLERVEDCLSGK